MEDKTKPVTGRERYKSGVMEYKKMGYWQPDYEPKDTDIIVLFRVTPQDGVRPPRGPIPERNGMVEAPRSQEVAVGVPGETAGVGRRGHLPKASFRSQFPNLDGSVLTGHRQSAAVRVKRQGGDSGCRRQAMHSPRV